MCPQQRRLAAPGGPPLGAAEAAVRRAGGGADDAYLDPQWGLHGGPWSRRSPSPAGEGDPPRVRQHGVPAGELHLRHRVPDAVAPREPQPRDARVARSTSSPRCRSPSSSRWPECIEAGHLVPVEGLPGAARVVAERPPQTDARFIFFAGELNPCFLPESQRRTYASSTHAPGYHALHGHPRLRPPRHLHGPGRGARCLPPHPLRARQAGVKERHVDDAKANQAADGRFSKVDGIPYELPINSAGVPRR